TIRYEPVTFVLSVVVAMLLATAALWVRYGLRHSPLSGIQRFLVSGTVLGLAIAAMHYTGMAGAYFIGEPSPVTSTIPLDTAFAALALSALTVTVTALVSALNGLIRSRELYRRMEESKSRLRATLDT